MPDPVRKSPEVPVVPETAPKGGVQLDPLRAFLAGVSKDAALVSVRRPGIIAGWPAITETKWFNDISLGTATVEFRERMVKQVLFREPAEGELRSAAELEKCKAELNRNPNGSAGHEVARLKLEVAQKAYDAELSDYRVRRITTARRLAGELVKDGNRLGALRQRIDGLGPGGLRALGLKVVETDPLDEVRLWVHAAICCEEIFFFASGFGIAKANTLPGQLGFNRFDEIAAEEGEKVIEYWEHIGFGKVANNMRKQILELLKNLEAAWVYKEQWWNAHFYAVEQSRIYEKLGDIGQAIVCLRLASQWVEHSSTLSEKTNPARAAIELAKADALGEKMVELITLQHLHKGHLDEAHTMAHIVVLKAKKASREFEEQGNQFYALRELERSERFAKGEAKIEELNKSGRSPKEMSKEIAELITMLKQEEISEEAVRDMEDTLPGNPPN